ncbi:hypothetical protein [Corynebacterium glyciniphilum]|uniref:hypothetical protein n=1 Tax=Corynebacterium glyciniphilum TaxID=1404244 RepID=UPI0011AB4E40|nr:hypothetical protein [Corynebacterium glyciniphilum]
MSTKYTAKTVAVGSAAALILTLAACSDGSDGSDDSMASGSSSSTPSASSTSAMTDSTMDGHSGHGSGGDITPVSTGDPFADAMTAASHMPMTGQTLADGIVASAGIDGDPDSDAATLHADLAANLQEHVYLAGMAVATAYTEGADSDAFAAASDALDANAVALADMVAAIDPDQRDAVLELWRDHIGYFVDYATAAKKGDEAAKAAAQDDLTQYTMDAGEAFSGLSQGVIDAGEATEGLQHHVDSLSQAIDALAAGDTAAYGDLHAAASHGGDFIATLASGLAEGNDVEGGAAGATDDAATLRVTLATGLQEHVYLAGVAVFTAYTTEGGTDSEAFAAAADTLDHNSMALSEAVGSVAGEEKGEEFLALWREHIGYFVDYANALATDDNAAADEALENLDGYRPQAGEFFAGITDGELDADELAEGLAGHISTVAGTIQSLKDALVD